MALIYRSMIADGDKPQTGPTAKTLGVRVPPDSKPDLVHTAEPAARMFARLLFQLHALLAEGKGDLEEADAIRDEMDAPWYAMTHTEQERFGGLSEDLYALAEGGPKPVAMPVAERQQWGQECARAFHSGDWDRVLQMLRHPPADVPTSAVMFLQARCWEHLGDPETALVFMQQAERLEPEGALFVMVLLDRLGRREEASTYAQRLLDDRADRIVRSVEQPTPVGSLERK